MKRTTQVIRFVFLGLLLFILENNYAQEQIAVIQSPNVLLLDAMTGDIVDPAFIIIQNPGTPKGLIQVDNEIWITHQIGDRIDRYDLDGVFISSIVGGLDNIRGLGIVNNSEVWVANAGTQNGAPGNAIVRFDFSGNNLGFFMTTPEATSPFDVVDNGNGEVYISYSSSNNIEKRDYSGNHLGNIVPTGVVSFIQQIQLTQNNELLAAVFSNNASGNNQGIYRFNITNGNILDYYSQSGPRGVQELGNGNILYTNSSGVHRINTVTGVSTLLSAGAAQFFGVVLLEECTVYPDPPTGMASQTFCEGDTVANLDATGQNIKWYLAPSGGTELSSSEPLVSGDYFASQTVDGCESLTRFQVSVAVLDPETPTGDIAQTFSEGATLADIVVTPANVSWYATEADALSGSNPLPLSTVLVDGVTYYAVNIDGNCLSDPLAVTVTITLNLNDFDIFNFSYYPNPTEGILNLNFNETISQVSVVNLLGQVVLIKQVNNNQSAIDLSGLPNGMYLVNVVTDSETKTIRIVKK